MKCEIAQDLLTLYAEDLCSAETTTELEAHLASCNVCSKKLSHYKSTIVEELSDTNTNTSEDMAILKPMKKVRNKLLCRKWLSIVLGLMLVLILGAISYLSYGQVTNKSLSFSSLADIYKLNKVTNAFTAGDTKPLMDILSFTFEEIYTLENMTGFVSFNDYKHYLQNKLDKIYEKDLKDKKLTAKLRTIYWNAYDEMYSIDSPITAYCYDFYDEEGNPVMSIDFDKIGPNKYSLSDYSTVTATPSNTFVKEFLNCLLPNEDLITHGLLQYPVRDTYEANMTEPTITLPNRHIATFIRYYDPDTDAENAALYKTQLEETISALYEDGIYFKDVLYTVDTFDTETGHWIYKVMFEVENQTNGESCVLTYRFNYYDYNLYVIPEETATLIGDNTLTTEQTQKLLTLFNQ